jgi:hypothetical protein
MHRSGSFQLNCLSVIFSALLPGLATAQTAPTPKPAPAKLPESGGQADLVEDPLTLRLVQLAFVETSLKLVDDALGKAGGKVSSNSAKAEQSEKGNELMNRHAGGPVSWEKFYGKTANQFYAGAAAGRRPRQFDYIYKANNDQVQRAKDEIAALGGKMDKLQGRKRQLENQQVALWGRISASMIAQRDLGEKPLYSFHLKCESSGNDKLFARRAETIEAFAQYLRVLNKAADYVDLTMEHDPGQALAVLKESVDCARKSLVRDLAGAIADDSQVQRETEPLSDIAKRLAVVTKSAVETRDATNKAEAIGDEAQRVSSRGLIQTALIDFADKTASLDDGVVKLAADWRIGPMTDKPLPEVKLVSLSSSGSSAGTSLGSQTRPASLDVPVGSIWKGTKHNDQRNVTISAALKITERDGATFKGEFAFGDRGHRSINVVAGTLADGKIEWEAKEVTQGGPNQPTSGTLSGDTIDATFKLLTHNGNKKVTVTGTIKLTKSE